jgi:hypothetical protein
VVIVVLAILGALLARDMLRLHRWSPGLFRSGPVVFRESTPLADVPRTLPTPFVRCGLFYSVRYRQIGPGELAFIASVTNAPMLVGRIVAVPGAGEIVMQARPYWGLHIIFLVGFAVAGFPLAVLGIMTAFFAANLALEVRQFHKVLSAVAMEAACQPQPRRSE